MQPELPVHQQLLLLVLDERKGTLRSPFAELSLAGALVFEVVDGGLATIQGEVLHAEPAPAGSGVLTEVTATVAAESHPRDVGWWVQTLPGRLSPFVPRLASPLVDQGLLDRVEHRVLGLIRQTRFPERQPGPRQAIGERVRAALLGTGLVDAVDVVLASTLDSLDLLSAVVSREEMGQARRRARELQETVPVAGATEEAVDGARAAVLAAVMAATTAATTAATISTTT